ncbi:MAG: hypothetical protein J6Y02_02795 [Pseudobutyrivibrio sp.]|nr:hypothetical protein [Pseudobutyrivibrio sp.]
MARPRHDLDVALRAICPNVYYQPPSKAMTYPCILYILEGKPAIHADNKRYISMNQYNIKYITRNPDDPVTETILESFENISFDRPYKADNLYHNVFTLYY